MLKKYKEAVIIILTVTAIIVGYFAVFIFMLINPRDNFTASPGIKYGEFDIRLTYELDGEIITIEDVVVCKYGGIVLIDVLGMRRKWNMSLKSGNAEIVLLDLRGKDVRDDFGYTVRHLFFDIGNGAYYMGDPIWQSVPDIYDYVEYRYYKNGSTGKPLNEYPANIFTAEEAYEKLGIRLISWECERITENNFKPPIVLDQQ